ncbi:MAG TPA: hydrogenase nickel incorporation protein HypA [Bacillota bacterium]|nr:hydrogenase nickel incorporation protein HypA [Bacillota bacterium]
MHEWALAESVVLAVGNEIRKENIKEICRVKIKIGELQQIDMEIFKLALENVLGIHLPGVDINKIILDIDECTLKCKVCENTWNYRDALKNLEEDEAEAIHFVPEVSHIYMRCPSCGSPDFSVVKGRGVWIDCIEGEK